MKAKRAVSILVSAAILAGLLSACGGKQNTPGSSGQTPGSVSQSEPQTPDGSTSEPPADDEDDSTGDASLDDPRNQDGIGETELLMVSFGTSFNDNRRLTIGAIEEAMEEAFPNYSVRRGFTAQIVIDHIQRRDGEVIDNVTQALERAVDNNVKTLIVQPTHLMDGFEYHDVADEVAQYADAFDKIVMGAPLLTSDEDFRVVAQAMVDAAVQYDDGKTALCFMGHGTEAPSNAVYGKMQKVLTDGGHANYFVGTVEAESSLDDVLELVKAGNYEMVPIYGDFLKDGTYPITVNSSSSMFKIDSCELTVENKTAK